MPRGRVSEKGYRANGPTVTFRLTDAEDAQLKADAEQAGVSKHALAKLRALAAAPMCTTANESSTQSTHNELTIERDPDLVS